jgi:putative SOS response-associated peptidase YedK
VALAKSLVILQNSFAIMSQTRIGSAKFKLEIVMCGRFSLLASPEQLCNVFEMDALEVFPPRYNIAPTQPIMTVGIGPNATREAQLVRWGLIPHWVKDPNEFTLIINARSETANTKASFKTATRLLCFTI